MIEDLDDYDVFDDQIGVIGSEFDIISMHKQVSNVHEEKSVFNVKIRHPKS